MKKLNKSVVFAALVLTVLTTAQAARLTAVTQSVDQYHFDSHVFANKLVKTRLINLLGTKNYQLFLSNVETSVPMTQVPRNDIYYLSGLHPHMGGSEEALFIYDGKTDAIKVYILSNQKKMVFQEARKVRVNLFDVNLKGAVSLFED